MDSRQEPGHSNGMVVDYYNCVKIKQIEISTIIVVIS